MHREDVLLTQTLEILTTIPQFIYENPSAGQNAVNFDMMAESGRLIVAVKLSDEIRNDFSSNFVYVRYTVTYADGTTGTTSTKVAFNGQ